MQPQLQLRMCESGDNRPLLLSDRTSPDEVEIPDSGLDGASANQTEPSTLTNCNVSNTTVSKCKGKEKEEEAALQPTHLVRSKTSRSIKSLEVGRWMTALD